MFSTAELELPDCSLFQNVVALRRTRRKETLQVPEENDIGSAEFCFGDIRFILTYL